MEAIKKEDEENRKIAETHNLVHNSVKTIEEMEELIKASVVDMLSYVEELDDRFNKEFEEENPIFGELAQKIQQIQSKYSTFINN